MIKRNICVVTGSRAEYGLLYWLMKEIEADKDFELKIIVTGMHLSAEYGNTFLQIEKDGFEITRKVDMLLSSNSELGVSKSMGLGLMGFADAFSELHPDLVIVLGDRFEIFSAVSAAMIAKKPVLHIHGGEVSEGSIDDSIRHSITKMSHLHFTATEEYKNRVIQLGENPKRVFNVGGLGIDNINKLKLLTKNEFENAINFKLGVKNVLVTFHPATLETSSAEIQFSEILESLDELENTTIIFTKSNSDADGKIINSMIDNYVSTRNNSIAFISMGQLNYLSALKFMDAVVGNSSSGLHEAPSFNIGTIDIGDRQKGRIKAESVISCLPKKEEIGKSFDKLYSKDFQNILNNIKNPYGSGGASKKIVRKIKEINFDEIIKKSFYDLKR